jgi:hypothetical protein
MSILSWFSGTARRGVLAGGAVLVIAAAAAGVAAAQTPTPSPGQGATPPAQSTPRPTEQAFLAALAQRLGIATDRLQQAITQARADVGLPGRGSGFGHFDRRGRGGGRGGLDSTVAAQAIGISVDQLRQELPGKSLAQVAQAHGKTGDAVATALKNAANQRIDQAVTAGRLTAEQATQQKQQQAQRIDQIVNQVMPQAGQGPRGGMPSMPGVTPSATPAART